MNTSDAEYDEFMNELQQLSNVSVKTWIAESDKNYSEKLEMVRIAMIVEGIMRSMFENEIKTMNKHFEEMVEIHRKTVDSHDTTNELLRDILTNPNSEIIKAFKSAITDKKP